MRVKILVIASLVLTFMVMPVMAGWQVIYSEDFSSDPAWMTNDSDNCYWELSTQTYHAKMINGVNYALKEIGWNNQSFIMEWDSKINSVEQQACMNFGIFDPEKKLVNYPSIAGVQGLGSWGHSRSLYVNDGRNLADDSAVQWEIGTWYTNKIIYNATDCNVTMYVYDRVSMQLVDTLAVVNVNTFPSDMDYLGLTSLHATDAYGKAADLNIDNVKFSQAPEPATLLLLGLGGILLRRRRKG